MTLVRDNVHYHATGDSVIRVENTLFKIHKFPLIQSSPVFQSMFSLPVATNEAEGLSDDRPIILVGDTAEDFRAVAKYMYASPIHIQIDSITEIALPEIISVAKFAHKYDMDFWQEWASRILTRLLVDLSLLPVEHFPALYSLYHRLADYPTRNRIMKHWCEVVRRDQLSIVSILLAADAADDRDALAVIYCTEIIRQENSCAGFDLQALVQVLPEIHIERLLSGYAPLSAWKEKKAVKEQNIMADSRALMVREWRHSLQKIFFGPQSIDANEMPRMDALFTTVAAYPMTTEYLTFSKIGKVMRHIALLDLHKVPHDAEFHFRDRAKELVNRWYNVVLADDPRHEMMRYFSKLLECITNDSYDEQ
ncbi:BTB domain-containing protein [Mycena sanguinolenta]|uniref:BTB domain-containing protein n=1 Tax=Mycena sanguinolenta TaxID=230812 RepID=A0A8H6Z170_9AGAR|nr:BTB domain-containing protein [Mycena sanguinolenta]